MAMRIAGLDEMEASSSASRGLSPGGAEIDKTNKVKEIVRALVSSTTEERDTVVACDSMSKLRKNVDLKRAMQNWNMKYVDIARSPESALFQSNLFVLKGQRSHESCHSFLLMRLSLGRGAGERPSAARHCGGAQSTAAPPSAPLLPRARAGARYDVVPSWYGTLGLSDTAHVESGELSCGAHVAQTAAWPNTGSRRMVVPSPDSGRVSSDQIPSAQK